MASDKLEIVSDDLGIQVLMLRNLSHEESLPENLGPMWGITRLLLKSQAVVGSA